MGLEINMKNNLFKLNYEYLNEILGWYNEKNEDVIFVVWNETNNLVYVSDYLSVFHEYDDISQLKWLDFLPCNTSRKILNHFDTSKDELFIPHIVLKNKQNIAHEFTALISLIYIKETGYYMCKLKNQTEINSLKRLLSETEKLKAAGEYSAGLVHEFRNPLTSLKGFLQLVASGVEQKEEYYKVMIDEVEKLEKLTSELSMIAKPPPEEYSIESMDVIIRDVLFLITSQSQMKNVNIAYDAHEELLLLCNPSQIKQVLLNLIRNGAEAMELEGELSIKAYRKKEELVVEIKDTGAGMEQATIDNLTTAFYTTKEHGTGLGLMISAQIVGEHDGRFEISSVVGIGSTFKIILPLSA